jgi:oligopeptide transport system permease protein
MFIFLIKRLISSSITLFFVLTLTYFLLRWAPGGPFDAEQAWPPEIQAAILQRYHLDLPTWTQYSYWLRDTLRGDLGESFQYLGQPVSELIGSSLPLSALLGGWALIFSITFGILLGCLAIWKRNSRLDQLIVFFSITGMSLPNFLIATLLVLIFSLQLGWLPPALWEGPSSAFLPIITLAWRPLAMIIRITRVSLQETLASDYIRTAYAKGASSKRVLFKHALKNSLIPVTSLLGPTTANLLTGSFMVEVIFQLPGLGRHFVHAVLNRDYPLVMGVTLTYGVILISANLITDLLYGWIDPRIRLEGKS